MFATSTKEDRKAHRESPSQGSKRAKKNEEEKEEVCAYQLKCNLRVFSGFETLSKGGRWEMGGRCSESCHCATQPERGLTKG